MRKKDERSVQENAMTLRKSRMESAVRFVWGVIERKGGRERENDAHNGVVDKEGIYLTNRKRLLGLVGGGKKKRREGCLSAREQEKEKLPLL